MDVLSWLAISCVMKNNWFSHAVQLLSLISQGKKVKDYLHAIWLACIWSIWKYHNYATFDNQVCLTHTPGYGKFHDIVTT